MTSSTKSRVLEDAAERMTRRKDRDRVTAEITLSYLLQMANEHGCPVSREQALLFLNQQGRAYEMWRHMMQAGEDFIARSLLGQSIPECTAEIVSPSTRSERD